MKTVFTIARKEVFSFFATPLAYVLLAVWSLWGGLSFYLTCLTFSERFSVGVTDTPLTNFFGGNVLFYIPLLVSLPLITMRLISEEKQMGTFESLLVAPVSLRNILMGKYLAAFFVWCVLWVPSFLNIAWLSQHMPLEVKTVFTTYLGLVLLGMAYISMGLWMSSMTSNQMTAALMTFLAIGVLFVLGLGKDLWSGPIQEVALYAGPWAQMESFSRGLIEIRYVVFNVSVACLCFFFSCKTLEWQRK